MKKPLLLFFFLCFFSQYGITQSDIYSNHGLHSIVLKSDTLRDCIVYTNYYTIHNNIDNKNSSIYISQNPSLDELINFACIKPSYFFIVITGHTVSHTIVMKPRIDNKQMVYSYIIVNSNSGNEIEIASKTSGDIAELRSAELILNAYDKGTKALQNGAEKFLFWGGKYYSIQSFQSVKEEVMNIISKYNLSNPDIDLSKSVKE